MHFIDSDDSIHGIELCADGAAVFFHLEFEGVDDIEYGCICVDLLKFKSCFLTVEHRHLKHLLHLEAESLGFIGYDSGYLLEHHGRFSHALVVEHLSSQ